MIEVKANASLQVSSGDVARQAAELHASLAAAQADLVAAIERLKSLSETDAPEIERVVQARWRLSLAQRQRRGVSLAAHSFLVAIDGDTASLRRVSELRDRLDTFIREYVAVWTVPALKADWPGYRAAQASKRALLATSLELERGALLSRLAALAG